MSVIIVGGGQGGFQAAASLRAEGYDGPITLFGEESQLPYQRPPLSKGLLLGKQEERHAILRPESFYETNRIRLVTGHRVTALAALPAHDWLILATGARPRRLPCPGFEHALLLRTLDEARALRERLPESRSVAIIGGGFIGLEVAAAACTLGKEVTVIESQSRVLARVCAPVVARFFQAEHESRGVRFVFNAAVDRIQPGAVWLRDRSRILADLVVAGVGVLPNDELARAAGLATGNGVQVDGFLRTGNPRVFAIGDCAEFPTPYAPGRVRLESVQNAVDQATSVAKAIMGRPAPYTAAPWFWSDQFDLHLQTAGLTQDASHTVVRGDPANRKFSVFYYRAGRLCAIDSVNRPAEHLTARKLIAAFAHVPPEQAADESFDLKSALP